MPSLTEWRRQAIESQMRAYAKRDEINPSPWPKTVLEWIGALTLAFIAAVILYTLTLVA